MGDKIYRRPPVFISKNSSEISDVDWYISYINYHRVQEITNSGEGAKVAVLDDTAVPTNDNLYDAIDKIYEFTSDEDGKMSGFHGHHVSGIIAAKNVGLFPRAKIGYFKVLTALNGTGHGRWIKEGIKAAKLEGYEVINASLGSDFDDSDIREAVKDFVSVKERFFVVAAGNDGKDTDYPAALANDYHGVISVGAAHKRNGDLYIPIFSSRGIVTLVAPGVDILSTLPDNKMGYLTGTSMAAPFISGLIASAKVLSPDFSHSDFYSIIKQMTHDVSEGERKTDGHGFVRFVDFLECVETGDYPKVEVPNRARQSLCTKILSLFKK